MLPDPFRPWIMDIVERACCPLDLPAVAALVTVAAYIRTAASGENDDGLISRFQLAVYPDIDQPFKNVDRWPESLARNQAHAVFEKLVGLDPGSIGAAVDAPGEIADLRFADDAQRFFNEWRCELETRFDPLGKRPTSHRICPSTDHSCHRWPCCST